MRCRLHNTAGILLEISRAARNMAVLLSRLVSFLRRSTAEAAKQAKEGAAVRMRFDADSDN